MYLKYFGIREKPFSITPDPRYLFLSEKHREALDHLIYGIHQGEGFMVITGDIGTGKTTLVRNLMERLEDQKTPSALILNPFLSPEELLLTILEDFGLQRKGQTKKALIDQLNTFLLDLNRRGKSAVLI
ncbi:MAG: AAA family ATPase, partial [Pseudomonadota bacterium]